jgi:hypothetical protein
LNKIANHSVFDCITDLAANTSKTAEVPTVETVELTPPTILDATKSKALGNLRDPFPKSHQVQTEVLKRLSCTSDHKSADFISC